MARLRKAQLDPYKNRQSMAVHLRKLQCEGVRGAPTPERALKANGSMRVGMDKVTRIEDSPLEKLAAKKTLAKDPMLNAIYKAAGERYYRDHYLSGLATIGAMDPSRINVDGGRSCETGGLPPTQRAEAHRKAWRQAAQAVVSIKYVGPRLLQMLDAVVLKEECLVDVGRRVTGYNSPHAAIAIALDRLIMALEVLSVHYGMKNN